MNENQHLEDTGDSWDKVSQKLQQNNKLGNSKSTIDILYEMDWFPMTTSPWISSIAFVHLAVFYLHIIDFYFVSYERIYSQTGLFTFSSLISPGLIPLGYVINIILNILSLISFFFNDINEEGLKYLVAWLGDKIFPVLRYVIQLNLVLAACLFIVDDASGAFFFLTAFINLFITFFAQNYILRKDYLCCKSVSFLILYKITLIMGYFINCLGYRLVTQKENQDQFTTFIIAHLSMSFLITLCYFIFGFTMYRHTTPRVLLVGSLSLYLSLSVSMLYDQINRQNRQSNSSQFIAYMIIFFGFISFLMFTMLQSMRKKGMDINQTNFKQKVFSVFNIMEGSSECIDDDCEIRGIIRYHIKNPCSNPNCFINRNKSIYDSKKNKECFLDKINQGKTSLTKFYLKCLYEQKLDQQNWSNTDSVLDYIEFFYMKLKNIFKVTHLINELQTKYLTSFQKLRLSRIKKIMLQQNFKLNNQLYLSQLDLENIIHSENKFDEIKAQIGQFLRRNLVFWKYVQKDSIDLSEMSAIVEPNFKLIQKINANWKQLAKYFQIQKRWKFYYVCYTLFAKNEKIKPQFLQYFGTNVHQEELFDQQSCHIDKSTQLQKLFNSKMMFESNTCYIHIDSHNEKSIIKNVSKYFTKMFKYQPAEILQSPLQILMPESVKLIHQKRFLQWAGQGKSNNQSTYQVKKIFPLTKFNFIIPVYKFYKQVMSLNKQGEYGLQYIAMIKKNKEDQLVAIVNANFQIEALTETLSKKFKLKQEDYIFIKKLNLLAFCPSLLKYTKFESEIKKGDDDFKKEDNKKNTVSHQISNPSNDREKKYSKILETKKELTESNCKIMIASDMRQADQTYQKGLKLINNDCDEAYYNGIRDVFYSLKKSRQYKKFKAQIQIKERSFDKNVYYQVYFRDMEQVSITGIGKTNCQQEESQKPISDNEHQKQSQDVAQQDFHLYFESNSNSQSISIAFTNNIFIKQDNNKPVQMISHVSSITITVRIFFAIFMILVFSTFFLQNINSTDIKERGLKLKLFSDFELKMYLTQNALYGAINGIQIMDWLNYELPIKTAELIAMKESYYLRKIILDQSVNKYNLFGPYTFISDFQTPNYDQIDLIDLLIEKVLALKNEDIAAITKTHPQFQAFQNYLIPSFNQLVNQTKIELNSGFSSHFQQTNIMIILLYVIQTLLLFVGFFVVFTRLIKISNSFIALMQIFTQLSDVDVKKVWRYSEYTMKLFVHLNEKDDQMSQKENGLKQVHSLQNNASLRGEDNMEEQVQNANLNKKVKKVQIGQQLTHIKLKSVVFIIIFLVLYGLSAYTLNIFITQSMDGIEQFKDIGYNQLFKYIPNMQIAIIAMQQKYNSPNTYNHSKYQTVINNLNQMKDINTVFDENTQFEKKYRTVFFDDFCLVHPNLFERDEVFSQCRNIAQNTLQHGIQSFLYYLYSDVTNLLVPTNSQITLKALTEDHTAVKIIDYYLFDLMNVWQRQFRQMIDAYKTFSLLISMMLILFHIIIYIILVEVFIVGNLKEKYEIFKKIYINYMPDFVVSKEKIIKAKLHVEGFIER